MALDNVALARDGLVGCNLHGCELETGTGLLETRRAYLVAVGEATGQRREALVAKQLLLGVQHTKIITGEERLGDFVGPGVCQRRQEARGDSVQISRSQQSSIFLPTYRLSYKKTNRINV